ALYRLCRATRLHPRCFSVKVDRMDEQPSGGGTFGDIFKGDLHGRTVSIKRMRVSKPADFEKRFKEFVCEAVIWRQFSHPNILPFFGLYTIEQRLCLVSPWMENGNIQGFLRTAPKSVDRHSLILNVALGLRYLHNEQRVVHGDLKAVNILVTPSRRACIADFGVSSVVASFPTMTSTGTQRGTTRYQAPELFNDGSKNGFESDVYAFGCVCYEILTEKIPFYEVKKNIAVALKVQKGERPSRPASCWKAAVDGSNRDSHIWQLLQECWSYEPATRPTAAQIVNRLVGPFIKAKTTQLDTTDWDHDFTPKFRRSLAQTSLPSVGEIERVIFGDGSFVFFSLWDV
ncbi:kinase-like domain-containing protein, partial [Mycena crocata]